MVSLWIEVVIAFFLVVGVFFILVGAVGLVRFSTFMTRLHAPTKASTLGLGSLLLVTTVVAWTEGRPGFAEVLITLFIFLTAPVSAAMLAQAALRRRTDPRPPMPPLAPAPAADPPLTDRSPPPA